MQQSQQQGQNLPPAPPQPEASPILNTKPTSAWQTISKQRAPPMKDVLHAQTAVESSKPSNSRSPSTPQLTMRQTVANTKPVGETAKHAIGPGGHTTVQKRNVSDSADATPRSPEQERRTSGGMAIPQSIRHQPQQEVEAITGLSISEIVAQQQLEKDVVKEAAAKRDLQDIQAEQEFEEWWNKESARVQEAEKRSAAAAAKKKHRGRGGRGGKKGKEKGEPSSTT